MQCQWDSGSGIESFVAKEITRGFVEEEMSLRHSLRAIIRVHTNYEAKIGSIIVLSQRRMKVQGRQRSVKRQVGKACGWRESEDVAEGKVETAGGDRGMK
jgi:hypothetical protein